MIGSRIPRYLLSVLTLGAIVAVILLSMFYGQYRWLAHEITAIGTVEHAALLRDSYEVRTREQLHTIADALAAQTDGTDTAAVLTVLNRALADQDTLTGARFISNDMRISEVGELPEVEMAEPVIWLADNLLMVYPVVRGGQELGILTGSFELRPLHTESRAFEAQLFGKEAQSRRFKFIGIGVGTLLTLLMCGGVRLADRAQAISQNSRSSGGTGGEAT